MTFKVLKSQHDQIDDFATKAATHAVEMKEWRAHQARVKADEANPDVAPIDRHWPVQRPDPHPLVAAAVNEKDEMDYELVDDSPTPDQQLRAKKNRLIDLVSAAEHAAVETIVPRGRARLFGIRESKIRARDAAAMSELLGAPSITKRLKKAVGLGVDMADLEAEVSRRRSPEDHIHLEDQERRRAAIEEIRSRSAIAHDAIEDLTADNVDSYKIPDITKD